MATRNNGDIWRSIVVWSLRSQHDINNIDYGPQTTVGYQSLALAMLSEIGDSSREMSTLIDVEVVAVSASAR